MSLTAAQRRKLPKSLFGLPGVRKYPFDTLKRGRNALTRAAQNETPQVAGKIRKRVLRHWPSIDKERRR